jgi:hypothetical protein
MPRIGHYDHHLDHESAPPSYIIFLILAAAAISMTVLMLWVMAPTRTDIGSATTPTTMSTRTPAAPQPTPPAP